MLVDFWSPICGPCRRLVPILDQLADEAGGRLRDSKVNVFEQLDVAVHYGISVVPTPLLFKNGEQINTLVSYQDKRRHLEALQPVLDGHAV